MTLCEREGKEMDNNETSEKMQRKGEVERPKINIASDADQR